MEDCPDFNYIDINTDFSIGSQSFQDAYGDGQNGEDLNCTDIDFSHLMDFECESPKQHVDIPRLANGPSGHVDPAVVSPLDSLDFPAWAFNSYHGYSDAVAEASGTGDNFIQSTSVQRGEVRLSNSKTASDADVSVIPHGAVSGADVGVIPHGAVSGADVSVIPHGAVSGADVSVIPHGVEKECQFWKMEEEEVVEPSTLTLPEHFSLEADTPDNLLSLFEEASAPASLPAHSQLRESRSQPILQVGESASQPAWQSQSAESPTSQESEDTLQKLKCQLKNNSTAFRESVVGCTRSLPASRVTSTSNSPANSPRSTPPLDKIRSRLKDRASQQKTSILLTEVLAPTQKGRGKANPSGHGKANSGGHGKRNSGRGKANGGGGEEGGGVPLDVSSQPGQFAPIQPSLVDVSIPPPVQPVAVLVSSSASGSAGTSQGAGKDQPMFILTKTSQGPLTFLKTVEGCQPASSATTVTKNSVNQSAPAGILMMPTQQKTVSLLPNGASISKVPQKTISLLSNGVSNGKLIYMVPTTTQQTVSLLPNGASAQNSKVTFSLLANHQKKPEQRNALAPVSTTVVVSSTPKPEGSQVKAVTSFIAATVPQPEGAQFKCNTTVTASTAPKPEGSQSKAGNSVVRTTLSELVQQSMCVDSQTGSVLSPLHTVSRPAPSGLLNNEVHTVTSLSSSTTSSSTAGPLPAAISSVRQPELRKAVPFVKTTVIPSNAPNADGNQAKDGTGVKTTTLTELVSMNISTLGLPQLPDLQSVLKVAPRSASALSTSSLVRPSHAPQLLPAKTGSRPGDTSAASLKHFVVVSNGDKITRVVGRESLLDHDYLTDEPTRRVVGNKKSSPTLQESALPIGDPRTSLPHGGPRNSLPSSGPKPALPNGGPKMVLSNGAAKPAFSNGAAKPAFSNGAAKPAFSNYAAKPAFSNGATKTPPSNGAAKTPPFNGAVKTSPSNFGAKAPLSKCGEKAAPSSGGTKDAHVSCVVKTVTSCFTSTSAKETTSSSSAKKATSSSAGDTIALSTHAVNLGPSGSLATQDDLESKKVAVLESIRQNLCKLVAQLPKTSHTSPMPVSPLNQSTGESSSAIVVSQSHGASSLTQVPSQSNGASSLTQVPSQSTGKSFSTPVATHQSNGESSSTQLASQCPVGVGKKEGDGRGESSGTSRAQSKELSGIPENLEDKQSAHSAPMSEEKEASDECRVVTWKLPIPQPCSAPVPHLQLDGWRRVTSPHHADTDTLTACKVSAELNVEKEAVEDESLQCHSPVSPPPSADTGAVLDATNVAADSDVLELDVEELDDQLIKSPDQGQQEGQGDQQGMKSFMELADDEEFDQQWNEHLEEKRLKQFREQVCKELGERQSMDQRQDTEDGDVAKVGASTGQLLPAVRGRGHLGRGRGEGGARSRNYRRSKGGRGRGDSGPSDGEDTEESTKTFNKIPSYISTSSDALTVVMETGRKHLTAADVERSDVHDHLPPDSWSKDAEDSQVYNKMAPYVQCFTKSSKYQGSESRQRSDLNTTHSPIRSPFRSPIRSPFRSQSPTRKRPRRSDSPISYRRKRSDSPPRNRRRRSNSPPRKQPRFRSRKDSSSSSSNRARSRSRSPRHRSSRRSSSSSSSSSSEESRSRSRSDSSRSSFRHSRHSSRSRSPRRRSRSPLRRSRSPISRRRSRSRERHRNRQRRSGSRQDRRQNRRLGEDDGDGRQGKKWVVYVGGIRDGCKKKEMEERFKRFGTITRVKIFFREGMDNYAFVYFSAKEEAIHAIDNGNKNLGPNEQRFELCFGGRRRFCNSRYADHDGDTQQAEEMNLPTAPRRELSFEDMLRAYKRDQTL